MISLLLALQVAAAPQSADREIDATVVEVTISVRSGSEPTLPASPVSRTRFTIAGEKTRFDRLEGTSPQILSVSPNAYSLSLSRGSGVYTIDSVKKEYSVINLEQMKAMMSDAMAALKGFDMKMTGSKFEVDSLGPGEPVLGFPTQRWQSVQAMTVSMAMGTDSMAMSMETRSESLYAPGVEALKASVLPEQDSLLRMGMFEGFLTDDLAESMSAAYARLPKGIPIRTVATTLLMSGMMDVTMITTTEVTKIEKVKRLASFFELPDAYQEVELDLSGLRPPGQ